MAFGSDKKPGSGDDRYGSPDSQSFFGKTMRIEGEITSDEDLTIEGNVKGKLEISKTLIIGKEGHVEGKISASVVRISGEAEGELKASQKLEISSAGKYNGNIKSETIKVAEGAQIKGTINLEEKNPTPPQQKDKKTDTTPIAPAAQSKEITKSTEPKKYPEKKEFTEKKEFPEKKELPKKPLQEQEQTDTTGKETTPVDSKKNK